jgi:hypothetical protein
MRLMGMTPLDISYVLNTSLENIQKIVRSPAAQTSFEKLYKNIINTNSDVVQGRIASHMNNAVDVVVSLMENIDTRDDVRLKAAQDVLDRGGTNPEHFFANDDGQGQSDDELKIVIMDEETGENRVSVEINRKGK